MTPPQLITSNVQIDGLDYQIGLLMFEDARPAYVKLQRLLSANDDEVANFGNGLFMFATYANVLTDEDLKYFVNLFGKHTQVAVSANQTVCLKDTQARDLVFAGKIDNMFAWLDACVEINFKVAGEKLRAARLRLSALAAAKAQAEAEKKAKQA